MRGNKIVAGFTVGGESRNLMAVFLEILPYFPDDSGAAVNSRRKNMRNK
jgi:hypothetical protein